MPDKIMGSIKLFSAPAANNPIELPSSSVTHFYTSGRVLSFFPQINQNGYTFFKDDVPDDMVQTLIGSTVDLQHVKKGYGIADNLLAGETNTIVGAITKVVKNDDGIFVLNKIEREVAKAFGFTPEDFGPDRILGKMSQECDYQIPQADWVVVDKNDPTKLVARMSYADGVAAGFEISHVENGEWKYHTDPSGNPVYMAVKPLSFAGLGHVVDPADKSAVVTKLAARLSSDKNTAFLPTMDTGYGPDAPEMMKIDGSLDKTSDGNFLQSDFYTHPDLLNADVGKFEREDDDGKAPDDHYAAVQHGIDYNNQKDGKPSPKTTRAFRIKNDKGEYDRKRLIAAYRALVGLRGDMDTASMLPYSVRNFALARVRHGLKQTNPKISKGVSTVTLLSSFNIGADQEKAVLAEVEKHLLDTQKLYSKRDLDQVKSEKDALQAQVDTLTANLKTANEAIEAANAEKATLVAALDEHKAREVSSTRYAELESVLPFSDEEKKAETHAEYIKNLAALSDDRFQIEKQSRIIAKLTATSNKLVASAQHGGIPQMNPVPTIDLGTPGGNDSALTAADLGL